MAAAWAAALSPGMNLEEPRPEGFKTLRELQRELGLTRHQLRLRLERAVAQKTVERREWTDSRGSRVSVYRPVAKPLDTTG